MWFHSWLTPHLAPVFKTFPTRVGPASCVSVFFLKLWCSTMHFMCTPLIKCVSAALHEQRDPKKSETVRFHSWLSLHLAHVSQYFATTWLSLSDGDSSKCIDDAVNLWLHIFHCGVIDITLKVKTLFSIQVSLWLAAYLTTWLCNNGHTSFNLNILEIQSTVKVVKWIAPCMEDTCSSCSSSSRSV